MTGTLLPSAEAASCLQLTEGDIRALSEKLGIHLSPTDVERVLTDINADYGNRTR